MEAFDDDLDLYYESIDKSGNCLECDKPIYPEKEFCSKECYKANQN